MTLEDAKKRAAKKAAEFIQENMVVGLGSGSTASYFIEELIVRKKRGLNIKVVSSSKSSEEKAKKGSLSVLSLEEVSEIDITVDGADEIDSQKRMIKGGGGALLREKIVASSSKEMIVIIDETKWVEHLGLKKLPLEVLPFGYKATQKKIAKLGHKGSFRENSSPQEKASLYKTDNGNYIYDLILTNPIQDIENWEKAIKEIPGVLETGLFFNLAKKVITGFLDGRVEVS